MVAVRSAASVFASATFEPVSIASRREAYTRLVPLKFAFVKLAFRKLAACKLALLKFVPIKLAPSRLAPDKSKLLSESPDKSQPGHCRSLISLLAASVPVRTVGDATSMLGDGEIATGGRLQPTSPVNSSAVINRVSIRPPNLHIIPIFGLERPRIIFVSVGKELLHKAPANDL
jgi:hypothetical protein